MPLISIITVNYNNAQGLERTIESVKSQSFSNKEFIVVDGDSLDSSKEVIKKNKTHIAKCVSEQDSGAYHAMNKGIGLATGEYLLFLNSGDHLMDNQSLTMAVEQLDGTDLVCFDIAVSGQGREYVKKHPDTISLTYMLTGTLAHQAVFIKRSLFNRFGLYDQSLKIVADWKFFLEVLLAPNTSYKAVHKIVTQYYLDGMSATAQGSFTRREERKTLLETTHSFLASAQTEHLLLQTNRFKILQKLEESKLAKKLNSAWLRTLLFLTKGNSIKDL